MKKTLLLALVCTGLSLGACGVKPDELKPPGGEETGFPHTYPDPATDPAPR
jgi:hypothetical protein